MDLAYWGFGRWPFQRQRAVNHSGLGASHEEALARLLFLVDERRRCGLLTGAAGTGKSCLLRRVMSYAQRRGRFCLNIDATGVGATELAWRIAEQLLTDCEPDATPAHCWSLIQQQLANQTLVGQPVVGLVDHLHLAEAGATVSLRRLMTLAESSGAHLTLLIAARNSSSTAELRDDIELSVELTGWSLDETSRFITDSVHTAGATSEIFSPESISAVHEITRGIPGEVVRVCDLSLLAAMSDGRCEVDAEIVEAAIAELDPRRMRVMNGTPAGQFA